MRFSDVKRELAEHGITIHVTTDGDYRVNDKDDREVTAQYTNNLDEALYIGIKLAMINETKEVKS